VNAPFSSPHRSPTSGASIRPRETIDFRLHALALKRMLAQQVQLGEIARQTSAGGPNPLVSPQRLPRLEGARRLRWFHIDLLAVTDDEVHFSGWAFVPEWRPTTTAPFLILSGQGDFVVPLRRVHRPDVAEALHAQPGIREQAAAAELAATGCRARFSRSSLGDFHGRVHFCLIHDGETAAVCGAESWSCEPAKQSVDR
jgi:hypothetical protein